jgi:hypothetical protein
MANKYIEKIAKIIDLDQDGDIGSVHDDPRVHAKANAAKLVNPSLKQRLKKQVARPRNRLAAAAAAASGVAYGMYKIPMALENRYVKNQKKY